MRRKKEFRETLFRHIVLLLSLCVIALHLWMRNHLQIVAELSDCLIHPLSQAMALWNDRFSFSMAEVLLALVASLVLIYLVVQVVQLIRKPGRGRRLSRTVLTLVCAGAAIYAGFCILWGTYYYGEDFITASGLSDDPVSVEQLEQTTRTFAELANEYAPLIARDENGICSSDREQILQQSSQVYAVLEQEYPCLSGPEVHAKPILHSRIMSALDFTGFYFPFTAEANVNMDSPACDFAATVAHELSHQRGVAKESEANFVAVLACLEYGDPDYVYSAALLAYKYLGNALYKASVDRWSAVYDTLSDSVLLDLQYSGAYWKQFDTSTAKKVSNTVYENFLYSYDQSAGLQTYGLCVDLLVNYYVDKA